MADSHAIVTATLNTSTGTQTITGSLGGVTPKLAIVTLNQTTADDTLTTLYSRTTAVTDGTTHFCTFSRADDGITPGAGQHARWGMTSNGTQKVVSNEQFLVLLASTTSNITAIEVTSPSLITNGISFTVSKTDGVAYELTCMFLYGDMECEVQSENAPATQDISTTYTFTNITGGEPSYVMLFHGTASASSRFGSTNIKESTGWAVNNVGLDQGCVCQGIESSVGTSNPTNAFTYVSDVYAQAHIDVAGGTVSYANEVTAFGTSAGSGTVDITKRISSSGGALGIVAVRLGSGAEAGAVITSTETTGLPNTQSVASGFGSVLWGMISGSYATAKNTLESGTSALSGCLGSFNASSDAVIAASYEDNVTTTVSKNYTNTIGYAVPTPGGAFTAGSSHKASVSPSGGNVDLAYTVTDTTTPRFFVLLAIGMTDPIEVSDEALGLSESPVTVQGNFLVVSESLGLTEGLVSQTINETFTTERKGSIDQGRTFRGDILQGPDFKGKL